MKISNREVVGAAQRAELKSLARLLDQGGDPNGSYRNYRPLHALIQEKPHADTPAATRDRLATLDLLLRRGADPEQLGAWPSAPATVVAAFTGSRPMFERLLAAGAERTLFVVATLGDAPAVRRGLRTDPEVVGRRCGGGLTLLQCAAGSRLGAEDKDVARGLPAVAQALLDAGADPNVPTRSWGHDVDAAYFAAQTQNTAIFELLLERGANAFNALVPAVWNSAFALAEMALAHGARIDAAIDGDRPLLNNLVRWGQFAQARWLLEKGASPNIPDANGWTALHQAASRGNLSMFEVLLDAGGDSDRRDRLGATAADVARAMRKPKLVEAIGRR